MTRRAHHLPSALTAPAILGLALACAGESGSGGAAPSAASDSPAVARVGDQEITRAELDDWIRDQLFQQHVASKGASERYEIRRRALDQLIDRRVLVSDAAERNLSEDEALRQAAEQLGPVTDEEVEAFFEEHRARFRSANATLENRGPQIRAFLERERQQKALELIRSEADVEVLMDAPRVEVAAEGPSMGPEDAPVTIVEFSDFQCPYCSRAEPVIRQVLDRYPERVRLVYRHMPLDSIHPRARPAAVAAVCAERQGRFWDYHAKLFENQKQLSDEDLRRYAEELDLDVAAFEECLGSDDARQQVAADLRAGRDAGVSGTPAFFVNGIMLSGAKPVGAFVEVIEQELERHAAEGGEAAGGADT